MNLKTCIVGIVLALAATAALPTASAWTVACTPNAQAVCAAVDAANEVRQCDGDPGVHACLQPSTPYGTCVLVTFGLQGAIACADADPPQVVACTSLYIFGVGHCPTDLL